MDPDVVADFQKKILDIRQDIAEIDDDWTRKSMSLMVELVSQQFDRLMSLKESVEAVAQVAGRADRDAAMFRPIGQNPWSQDE